MLLEFGTDAGAHGSDAERDDRWNKVVMFDVGDDLLELGKLIEALERIAVRNR